MPYFTEQRTKTNRIHALQVSNYYFMFEKGTKMHKSITVLYQKYITFDSFNQIFTMKSLILLLSFILSSQAYSQINFESGYLITNSNTKTSCLIRNVGWQKNPTKVEYKLNKNSPSQFTTIAEIKEFNVGEKYKFVRFNTSIDRSSSNIDLMTAEKNPVFKDEILFLKVLVEGEINLYEYEDTNLVKYFISSGDHSNVTQLVYKEYLIDNAVAKNNNFRQQLSVALKSDALKTKDFEYLKYEKKSLVGIVEKYDSAKGIKWTNFEIKQNQASANVKVFAGVNFSSLSLSDSEIAKINVNFDSEAVFVTGLEAEFILPFNQNKWSLFVAPNFQSYTSTAHTSDNKLVEADYKFIELPFGVRYSFFIKNRSQIFINTGYTLPLDLNSTISYQGGYSKIVLDIKSLPNLFAGIGFRKNKLGLEIRYNTNREVLRDYKYWSSKYSSAGILVSYKIF